MGGRRSVRLVALFSAIAFCLGFVTSARAQVTANTPVFGPQTYTRTTGAPNEYTTTFAAPSWIVSPYNLHIVNGDASGTNRISYATIALNGVQIAGPSDFNQNVATLDRSVTLQATNTLQVTLASKPGSFLTINVAGTNGDHTPPQIKIVSPANTGYINTATPSIEVTYSDAVGTGEPGASGVNTSTFKATLDGVDRTTLFTVRSTDASATIPASLTLSSGAHTLVVTLQDNAGNKATSTSQFTVDLGVPQIQIVQPVLGAYLNTFTPTISVQYSDSIGVNTSTLKVSINGTDETSLFTKTNTGATATPPASLLVQGANQIVAQIQNLAGTPGSASTSFNVDTTPPTISIAHPAANSYHGSSTIDITVQYTDDQAIDTTKLQVTLDGVSVSMAKTLASATGSVPNVANGAHILAASIADLAGNVSNTQVTFYVDTTIPTIHVDQPAPNAILNTHTPQVAIDYSDIQGVDTTTLKVFVNNVDFTSLFSIGPSGATAQLSGAATLVEGQNTIVVQIANHAGTIGTSTSTFTVDTIPPSIVFQAPPSQTNSNTPTVTIAYSDAGSGVNPYSLTVKVDGIDVSALIAPGATSATGILQLTPPLSDGTHQLSATVADRAGNVSQPATLSFVVDTIPPTVAFTTPANNSFINNPTPSILLQYSDTGTGVATSSVQIQLQQGASPPTDITSYFQIGPQQATGAIPAAVALNDGTYTFSAVVSDLVGNSGSARSTFVVDTVPPTSSIQAPAANAILATSTVPVVLVYQDDRSGIDTSRITLTVDGVNQTAILAITPTQATGTLPALPDGSHTIQLAVYDRSGNPATAVSQTFTTDTTPPLISASVSPPPNSANWNKTAVTVSFNCTDSGSGIQTCPAPVTFSNEGKGQQACGQAVDAAGNTSLPTCATVNIDLTIPTITASVSPSPNANGIITSVPVTITFQCSDNLSGVAVCPSPITITNPGLNQMFNGTAFDVAGNMNTIPVTVSIQTAAPTPPSIGFTISPQPNAKAWNKSPVTVTFQCAPGSNPLASCPSPIIISTEGTNQPACGKAIDNTGLPASTCAYINLDMTPPTITATPAPPPQSNTWNTTPVTVTFKCADNLSGVSFCPPPQTISTDGFHQSVTGTATDNADNNSVTAQLFINLDQTPPSILQFTAPTQLAPGQSGTATVNATDNIAVASVVIQLNGPAGATLTVATLTAAPYTTTFTVPSSANAGDTLTLTASATDLAGNVTSSARGIQVVPAGVVTGQVLSDTTGLPFTGATVQVVGANAQDTSDNTGRYSIPSNTSHLFLSVSSTANATTGTVATTTVEREVSLQTGVGTVPVDARLTQIAAAIPINAAGGSLLNGSLTVSVAAGAVSSSTNFHLTTLSQQGLPGLLPLGWSPVAAFDLRADTATSASFTAAFSQFPNLTVHLVRYDFNSHSWLMVTPNLTATSGALTIPVPSVGDFALVTPDAGNNSPPVPSSPQPLTGVSMVALPAGSAASGSLNPPSVSPTGGTSSAILSAQSSVPLPSGTVIQAKVQDLYSLVSGKQLSTSPRMEDVILYQFAAPSGSAGAAAFPVTASQTFQPGILSSGVVHLDILSGRESIRGQVGGSDAASVTGGDATLAVAAGSLPQDTAISVAPEGVDTFLPSTATLLPLAEYNIDLSGQILLSPAQLTVAAGGAKSGDTVVLAQIQRIQDVPYLIIVSLAQVNGTSLVTQAAPGFSGITQGGDYVFYKVTSPTGYVSGTVAAATGPVPALIQTDGLPFAAFASSSGSYVTLAAAGPVNLTASVLNTAVSGTATAQVTAGQTATANITVTGQTETATVTPPNGAVGVPLTAEIDITAPDALNEASVTTSSVTLVQNGQGTSTPVPVRFVFTLGDTRLSVFPLSALQPSTTYTLSASGLANAVGGLVSVPTVTFTTQANTPPNFNPDALVFGFPDQNGNVAISAPASSFPSGSTILIVDQTNGVVLSLTVANDGSVTGQMPATIDDVLAVTITAPDKTTASFTRSKFVAPDGTTAIGPGGGTVVGPGNTGLIIPAGALTKGTTFKLTPLDQTSFPQLPSWSNVNFGSGIQINAPAMPIFATEIKLAFPVPPAAPQGAFFYVFRKVTDQNGNVFFETIDHAFVQGSGPNAQVVTASPPFCGYRNSYASIQAIGNGSFVPILAAITEVFMMWDIDPNQPGVASPGLVVGNVRQTQPPGPGQTDTQFVPLTAGAAKITLTDYPQFFSYSSGQCSTFSVFDPVIGGGTRRVKAEYNNQEIDTTVVEVSGAQPQDALFPVTGGLERLYRNIGRINFNFAPPTPPAPPPQINIELSTIDPSGQPQPIQGIVQVGTPILATFTSTSTLQVVSASFNGSVFSSVSPDPPVFPAPGLSYFKLNGLYVPLQPGLYTVVANALAPLGGTLPASASRSFLVVAAGATNGTPTLGTPPTVVLSVPGPKAVNVPVTIFPNVIFSEPVSNVSPNVAFSGNAIPGVDYVLIGVHPDGTIANPVAPSDWITSLTLRPLDGLDFGQTYTLTLYGGIIDQNKDQSGNPLHLSPYSFSFTTAAYQEVGFTPLSDPFAATRPVIIGQRAYLGLIAYPTVSVLDVVDISDPTKPIDEGYKLSFVGRAMDAAGETAFQYTDYTNQNFPLTKSIPLVAIAASVGATDFSIPSNIWLYDVSSPDAPVRLAGLSATSSATADGTLLRIAAKGQFIYASTFLKGLQVIDLQQAIQEFQTTPPTQAGQALTQEGQGFAIDSVVNTIPMTVTTCQSNSQPCQPLVGSNGQNQTFNAVMWDLKAGDFATAFDPNNPTTPASTRTLVVATGLVPFVVADPAKTSSSAILYPPLDSFGTGLRPDPIVSSDGKYQFQIGRAVVLGTIPITSSFGGNTTEVIAALVGNGVVTSFGVPSGDGILVIMNMSDPKNPVAQGFLDLGYGVLPRDVVLSGTTLMIGTTEKKILLVNINNPQFPVSVGEIDGDFGDRLALTASGYIVTTSGNLVTGGLEIGAITLANGVTRGPFRIPPPVPTGKAPDCEQSGGDPINFANGNAWIEQSDYSIPGLGSTHILRTWNSQWTLVTPVELIGTFGHSWRSNFDERLVIPVGTASSLPVQYWRADGSLWYFATGSSAGTYVLISPANQHASFQVNSSTQVATMTFPDGSSRTFNPAGYLTAIIDRNGNQTTIAYDSANRIASVTDPGNRVLTFNYVSGLRQVQSIQDAVGTVATYTYDADGHLTKVAYPDNSTINMAYDSSDLLTTVTDSNGKVIQQLSYDTGHRALSTSQANGVGSLNVAYSAPGQTQVTNSQSQVTTYNSATFGGRSVITSLTGPGCEDCGGRNNTSFTYDTNGNRTSRADALGTVTQLTYDAAGNILTRTLTSNNTSLTWTFTYNAFGEILAATDPQGRTTTNTYDGNGNLLTSTTPSPDGVKPGNTTTASYNARGEMVSYKDPLGRTSIMTYTPAGLLASVKDPLGSLTQYTYDGRGNLVSATDPLGKVTKQTYDGFNRPSSTLYSDGSTLGSIYDLRGRLMSMTDQDGKTVRFSYDDANHLLSITGPRGNVTSYSYDSEGRLVSITDANNRTTSFTIDSLGRTTAVKHPNGLSDTFFYDAVGNLTSKTDRNGNTISYIYDGFSRPVQKKYPDNTAVSYVYDGSSHLTQVSDPTGIYSFNYDNDARLTQTTTSYSFLPSRSLVSSYSYDAASNVTAYTDPEGGSTTLSYNPANRPLTITTPEGSFVLTYDSLGRRSSLSRPNGVTTSYSMDAFSRPSTILHQRSGATFDGATFTFDPAGIKTGMQNSLDGSTQTYSFDPIYELTGVTRNGAQTESYAYDQNGNLTNAGSASLSYNTSNQLVSDSTATYTYDNNGNLLTKTDPTGTTKYAWDFENRLISVTLPGGSLVSFKYDPLGRRIFKSSPSGTTIFAYDHSTVVEELDASGNLVSLYRHGVGVDEPLAILHGGVVAYYEQDDLGSVTSLTDSSGALLNSYVYDSAGRVIQSTGSFPNSLLFTGREFDAETGLYFDRARYYSPAAHRFLSEDPYWPATGANPYIYAFNNPVLFSDPYGLDCVSGWARLRLLGGGLLKVGVGAFKIGLAAGGDILTAGVATPAAFLVGVNGGANVFSGLALIYGAASGDKENAEQTAQIADALSTPTGIFTLAVTKSLAQAQLVSAVTEVFIEPSDLPGGAALGPVPELVQKGERISAVNDESSQVEKELKKMSKQKADCGCKE